jgi:flavin reductase (DIM6/NTAB) family NADH-FMN oxidoreductase RutF/uncharacterized damage-inducible protein DinB
MRIDPAGMAARDLYRLMITLVVPRPIAWVSTLSASGKLNAAPFSYFQAVSSRPPVVLISCGRRRDGRRKDTWENIEATGEFVVNVVSEASAARMVATSAETDESEFEAFGLAPLPSERVRPPRIAECLASMECRLERVVEIGPNGVLFGEVVLFHVDDGVLDAERTADPARLKPLGRLGGSLYAPLREIVAIGREGAGTARKLLAAEDEELLRLWRDLRRRSAAIARALAPEHLARTLGEGGETVGRILRHLAGATTRLRLRLAGREREAPMEPWDPSWTPERVAEELEEDREAFSEAMRAHLPEAREELRGMVRHEAWHQGQIAAAVRDAFPDSAIWRLGA